MDENEAAGRTPRRLRLLPSALLLCFALLCLTSLLRKSATFDESHYLGVGRYWITHQSREIPGARLHPPLSSLVHGLPLLAVSIPEEIWREPNMDVRGQRLIDLRTDDWMLDASRLAMLPVALLLGALVFVWSRRLYGFWGAALSLGLFSFSPNLIAHARLITPDVTLTLCTTLGAYRLWLLAERRGARQIWLAGACLGLLLLSKHTALVLIPILALTDLVHRLQSRSPWRAQLVVASSVWWRLLAIALLVLWAGHGFDLGMVELRPGLSVPLPAPDYFEGALFQWRQSQLPHDFFLMGRHSQRGWWYFYAVVLAIKLPIPILLLTLGLWLGRWRSGWSFAPREIYLWLPPVLLFVYLSLFNTIHNGLRYWLPVYPLLLILLGKYAEGFAHRRWLRGVVVGAFAWLVAASLWIWPDYLAYHNESIGGPREAYRWSSDSNLDWGQDLKQLKAYLDARGLDRVQLAYFGTADPAHYHLDYEYLPSANSLLRPTPPVAGGSARTVALSAYQYQSVALPRGTYESFHRYVPNDLVGYSILIFDLDDLIARPAADRVDARR